MERREFKAEYNIEHDKWAIESEQIVDVPLFSAETLMPVPEKSHAQELLDIPIPLENRIAHLIPYIEPVAGRYTQHTIARSIGADSKWVIRIAERIGIEPISEMDEEGGFVREYPSPALEVLQEEWDWYRVYRDLDEQMTETAIANFVAKSSQWVRKYAHELGEFPVDKAVKSGRERFTYSKTLIPKLRHLLLIFPPAEDWYTKKELMDLTGREWSWIEALLQEAGIEIQERYSPITSRLQDYIAPESYKFLMEIKANLPPAAGSGLTIEAIGQRIGRSHAWIVRRMPADYKLLGRDAIDGTGRVERVYDVDVWGPLEEQSRAEATDTRLARIAIARAVGKSWAWVENRLPYTGVDAEESAYRSYDLYDEEVAAKLRELAAEEDADTRLSVAEIAKILGHTGYWVKARLPFVTIPPEEKRGKKYAVYKDEIIEQFRALPEDIITMGRKPTRK